MWSKIPNFWVNLLYFVFIFRQTENLIIESALIYAYTFLTSSILGEQKALEWPFSCGLLVRDAEESLCCAFLSCLLRSPLGIWWWIIYCPVLMENAKCGVEKEERKDCVLTVWLTANDDSWGKKLCFVPAKIPVTDPHHSCFRNPSQYWMRFKDLCFPLGEIHIIW